MALPSDYSGRRGIAACQRAGLARMVPGPAETAAKVVPLRIPHDLRRTAVRNLERAGVPRSTAMAMVGHKTESIYRRYAICDEGMLREGAARLAALHESQRGQVRNVVTLPLAAAASDVSGPVSGPVLERELAKLVAWDGIEPPTRGFSVRCSTS
jgi:hypothetical protein